MSKSNIYIYIYIYIYTACVSDALATEPHRQLLYIYIFI